ncbi:NADP-specific glutamate dehydrogenase [Venturia inaequalis]|nr:NADP-specific glutamate dehydrogenase [Venturia inaequalis]
MPRILLIISTRNRIKARAYKQPQLPTERLWLSITGLSSPYPVSAALSRGVNPPAVIALPAVATLASSLSGRPAYIEVKPQLKKRKRDATPASPATTASSYHDDDASSTSDLEDLAAPEAQEVPIDPALFEIDGTPVPEQAVEVLTPPSSSAKRQRVSLDLGASSLLLSPAEERPAGVKFSPGQALWANSMISAIMDGKVLAGEEYEGADCSFLVQAVRDGALEVEKDSVVEMGMDGHARDENMEKFDALLGECLKKEEVVVEEEVIEEESSEEEMSDVEEDVEDGVEYASDDEEATEDVEEAPEDVEEAVEYASDDEGVAEDAPIVVEDESSSDDEVYSSEEED